MLETVTFARASALAHRPAPSDPRPHARRRPGAVRRLRVQWRRLRRLVAKPGIEFHAGEAVPCLS